ncbi:MAG: signal peptidase II [Candidatus Dormibacteraeota bacterium]|nr:signal peptidase II [Candidatus Dormibacteraeota bacterium]
MVFVLDRVTKSLVAARVPYGTEVPLVGHLVGIANVHNSGAAFGLVPAGAAFFLVAAILVSIGLVIYVARSPSDLWTDVALGLIMGGTVGNGADRIMFGTVTDFINFHFFPVFNVADSAITIGVVGLVAGYLKRKPTA